MPDYKSDKIHGWQRCPSFNGTNILGEIPDLSFQEEVIINVDGVQHHLPSTDQGLYTKLTDPSKILQLVNPMDDSLLGETTFGMFQVYMYSMYKCLVAERDNQG